jgi:hypothetical protein
VKYELLIRGRAKRDVRRAAKWYERQHEGPGKEFVVEADVALERIAGKNEAAGAADATRVLTESDGASD